MSLSNRAFITVQKVVPQRAFSRLIGTLAASETLWIKRSFIERFAQHYVVDMSQAAQQNLDDYPSFNAFFTRALRVDARPIDASYHAITSPADGAISQLGTIDDGAIFQAKGQSFHVATLLGDAASAEPFMHGQFATVYLSPRDYHRVHMPFAGVLRETIYIPGELFSVNAVTAQHIDGLFARNERLVCLFDTSIGRMAVVLVGAMIVAGIECVATGKIVPSGQIERLSHDLPLGKGDELGRFYLGSTAIVLFEKAQVQWQDALQAGSAVMMGARIGQSNSLSQKRMD